MRGRTLRAALFSLAALGWAAPACASTIAGYWIDGEWRCTIDGRPARMSWRIVDTPQGGCSGGVCWQQAIVSRKGSFLDNNTRWVPLTNLVETQQGGFFFRHADGNRWFLPKPAGGVSRGHTVWQGTRYPLVCRR